MKEEVTSIMQNGAHYLAYEVTPRSAHRVPGEDSVRIVLGIDEGMLSVWPDRKSAPRPTTSEFCELLIL
jgi:hypothetical protein